METNNIQLLEKEIISKSKNGRLTCTSAFEIVSKNKINPEIIGKAADKLKIKLSKCQLGLFGHKPENKIKPAESIDSNIETAILKFVDDNRIACEKVWHIADELNLKKIEVSKACEAMSIRIKPCQLGAF